MSYLETPKLWKMDFYNDGSALPVASMTENLTSESGPTVMNNSGQTFLDNIMPDSLEFFTGDVNTISCPVMPNVTESITPPQADDLGFLVSEDSIALSEAHFDHLSGFVDSSTVSPCFSKSRQLACEDSVESMSREAASTPQFQECRAAQDTDDILLATAEETSMDSGLGSVESAYPNSEEESTGILSPDSSQPLRTTSTCEGDLPVLSMAAKTADDTQETVFYDCLPDIQNDQVTKKRARECVPLTDDQPKLKKRKTVKKVSFENVTVFYFRRMQGFVSVPSQGGSTLGMGMQHVDHSTMSIQEHYCDLRRRHKEKVLEHMRERKIEDKIKELKFVNPELDNGTLSTIARNAIGEDEQSQQQSDDSILENYDEFFFLQPVTAKKRRKILRLAGVDRIDGEEKFINRILRESREMCGCSCQQVCHPETCECALAGIQCQVDRESFPCGCIASGCQNGSGRIEFDSERVRVHLLATLEKLRYEEETSASQHEFGSEQTASSGSECDFMSSDDADQSDCEIAVMPQCSQSSTTITNVCVTSPGYNPVASTKPEVPQHYLDILGLRRVEIETDNTDTTLSSPVPCSRNFDLHFTAPQNVPCENFYANSHSCKFNSIESLAQSVPDPPPPPSRQMYGTTSNAPYCQGGPEATRDFSIPLEPIASFMTTNYNIATTDSFSCSSSF